MSTRATYRFNGRAVIYVHYDGYPEGAASYFYETLIKPSKGDFATQFIRAVDQAELHVGMAESEFGDTEYHYEVTGHGPTAILEAFEYSWTEDAIGERRTKKQFFEGPIHTFCEKNLKKAPPFRTVRLHGCLQYMNAVTAREWLTSERGRVYILNKWAEHFTPSYNWDSAAEEFIHVLDTFPEIDKAEIFACLSSKAIEEVANTIKASLAKRTVLAASAK